MLRFMNFNGLVHSCSKNFNCQTNCKHMLHKEKKKKKKHLHSSSDGFDVWPQNPDRFVNCRRLWSSREADIRTRSARSGANLRGSLHWPWPDKVPVDKTSFISSCCCRMGAVVSTNSLRTAGLKGESHVRLNFRLDQKECNLGSGRQQSLLEQKWSFGEREEPRHQIAWGKNHVFPGIKGSHPFSLFFLFLSLSLNLSWNGFGWNVN